MGMAWVAWVSEYGNAETRLAAAAGTRAERSARACVLAALDAVPHDRRAVLIMHDLDELPMR